jgi:hypothetical protein
VARQTEVCLEIVEFCKILTRGKSAKTVVKLGRERADNNVVWIDNNVV